MSRLSAAEGAQVTLCEHEVPASVCTRCNPELEARYREIGDWCGPHSVPESQCHPCHPDLRFLTLPDIAPEADYLELTEEQALEGIEHHLGAGRITIVDFYAPWCAPCLNLEVELHELANAHHDIAVRKVTIMDWEGPVVERYLADVNGLPYVRVFDASGNEAGEFSGAETDDLAAVVERLRAR